MTPVRTPKRAGAALIITLILVTAIALVVISFFAITRQEAVISSASISRTRADLGEKAAFEDAGARLLSLTANDHYLVTSVEHQETGEDRPARYTFVSTPDASGVTHSALFAGGGEQRLELPDLNAQSTGTLTDGPIGRPAIRFERPESTEGIKSFPLTHLARDGSIREENNSPKSTFRELEPEEPSPFRTRYTYWIEDLEGYPNLDVVGAWTDHFSGNDGKIARDYSRFGYGQFDTRAAAEPGGNSGASVARLPMSDEPEVFFQFPAVFRGQSLLDQVAPGLSTREISLLPWRTGSRGLSEHPFAEAGAILSQRHFVATRLDPFRPGGEREPGRFATGLQAYRRIPMIPFAHGYADEGKPRHNLNTLVSERDLGIATIIERNLPAFVDRKGGFPGGESYLGTLAANAIDYADEDSLPSLPGNTTNVGSHVFRGVDTYCPVNEFYVQFRYVGYETAGTSYRIVFEATPFAEFWNPANRLAKMEQMRLKFRFLERIRFKANANWFDILDSHRVLNEPFPDTGGRALTIQANGCEVISFGKIRWKVPIPRDPQSPIAYPVVQDIRGGANTSTRAHYELYLGPDLVDSCGRGESGNSIDYGFVFPRYTAAMSPDESFMRLATPNLATKAFGFNAGFGSHFGDPWMPYYSRSTAEDAQYRFKATPGSRNFDPSKVSATRPDWFKDQTRVRDWPDRGYDTATGKDFPSTDRELPDTFNHSRDEGGEAFAPWRISNLGRFYSVTELGNLHDPVMWVPGPAAGPGSVLARQSEQLYGTFRNTALKSLPDSAIPGKMWGGGNTLRIGRPEHELFDRPGMRASQWLDLFHAGFTGTNLTAADGSGTDLYTDHDPRDHQPPPAASDPVESLRQPYASLYESDLNARGRFTLVYGHLNLNSAPTLFEIEMLLRGPFVSSDIRLEEDRFDTPVYSREGVTKTLRSGLKPDAIPKIAAGLFEARPFYSPSHLARVLSGLIDRHDALPDHHNDAEAEETFARIFNTTTFSSRHFRVFTYAEIHHPNTGEITGRARRVYEVFLRPIRNASGEVERSRLEVISSRDL